MASETIEKPSTGSESTIEPDTLTNKGAAAPESAVNVISEINKLALSTNYVLKNKKDWTNLVKILLNYNDNACAVYLLISYGMTKEYTGCLIQIREFNNYYSATQRGITFGYGKMREVIFKTKNFEIPVQEGMKNFKFLIEDKEFKFVKFDEDDYDNGKGRDVPDGAKKDEEGKKKNEKEFAFNNKVMKKIKKNAHWLEKIVTNYYHKYFSFCDLRREMTYIADKKNTADWELHRKIDSAFLIFRYDKDYNHAKSEANDEIKADFIKTLENIYDDLKIN